jgi:Bacterial SH3 domain
MKTMIKNVKNVCCIAIFAIANLQNGVAQESPLLVNGNFYPWHDEDTEDNKPKECLTAVTDANVRATPNANAAVVAKLPIATKVTITQVTTDTLTLNGFPAPWCKVSFNQQGKNQSGYLWGGTLAFAAFEDKEEYSERKDIMYLVSMSKMVKDKYGVTLQMRTAKNNVELAKTEFMTTGDVGHYLTMEMKGSQGLRNVQDIVEVTPYFPACGYPSATNVLFVQDKKITRLLETTSTSDVGVFYASENAIYPYDKGGINNHIVVISDQGETEEKQKPDGTFDMVSKNQKYGIIVYKWDGQKLNKVKELK